MKTINTLISITEKDWKTGKEDSKSLYGTVNFSGYVSFLIREANKKKKKTDDNKL